MNKVIDIKSDFLKGLEDSVKAETELFIVKVASELINKKFLAELVQKIQVRLTTKLVSEPSGYVGVYVALSPATQESTGGSNTEAGSGEERKSENTPAPAISNPTDAA